jgi:hypothetical protein
VAAVGVLLVAVLVPFLLSRGNNEQTPPPADPSPVVVDTPSPDAPAAAPAGYRLYRDRAGWSIAVPSAWRAVPASNAVTFRDGDRVLHVVRRGNPPQDPYAAQLKLEPVVRAGTAGYDLSRIARVTYRGWPTADWEYRAGSAPLMHSLVRSTVPDSQQVYEIAWTTLDSRWTADKVYFDNAVRTFDPAG